MGWCGRGWAPHPWGRAPESLVDHAARLALLVVLCPPSLLSLDGVEDPGGFGRVGWWVPAPRTCRFIVRGEPTVLALPARRDEAISLLGGSAAWLYLLGVASPRTHWIIPMVPRMRIKLVLVAIGVELRLRGQAPSGVIVLVEVLVLVGTPTFIAIAEAPGGHWRRCARKFITKYGWVVMNSKSRMS